MSELLSLPAWQVSPILWPLLGALLAFLLPRRAQGIGLVVALLQLPLALVLIRQVHQAGPLRYQAGGWEAPLGINLYLDGLSTGLLAMTALVGVGVSLYTTRYFHPAGERERAYFWPLWLLLLTALSGLLLSADLFNLYVTLELLGLSSAALIALPGRRVPLEAAARYLLVTLLGSLCYLLGVALLYGRYGVLDLALLAQLIRSDGPTHTAVALILVALALKSALFPLHFWLPPAHANAPAPVSALLSALVVKATFYLLLRLWFDLLGGLDLSRLGLLLGILGAAAVIWGSLQALLQRRLKLLVAYSTVAQVGYLILGISLAGAAMSGDLTAWSGTLFLALTHAFAKAGMFLCAGIILHVYGHDEIVRLQGLGQCLPITLYALGIAGASLIGLPPTGAFIGKWQLIQAALTQSNWAAILVLALGTLLAAAYVFRVISSAYEDTAQLPEITPATRRMEWAALALALAGLVLGLIPGPVLAFLTGGRA